MSATCHLMVDAGGGEQVSAYDCNITYNLGPMLRAAGFPDWHALQGAPASETGGMLRKVAETLRADPGKFREMNPPNGWGDYDGALRWLEGFADACARYPATTVTAYL